MPNRKEMFAAIKSDYSHVPDEFINIILDLHEQNSGYIEDIIKEEKRKNKGKIPAVKRQLSLEEYERIHAKFKEEEARILLENKSHVIKNIDDGSCDSKEPVPVCELQEQTSE